MARGTCRMDGDLQSCPLYRALTAHLEPCDVAAEASALMLQGMDVDLAEMEARRRHAARCWAVKEMEAGIPLSCTGMELPCQVNPHRAVGRLWCPHMHGGPVDSPGEGQVQFGYLDPPAMVTVANPSHPGGEFKRALMDEMSRKLARENFERWNRLAQGGRPQRQEGVDHGRRK